MNAFRVFAVLAGTALSACAEGPVAPPPAQDGWIDLFPERTLKGWTRVPIDPLAAKTVWSLSADGKLLLCDGTGGVKEILLHDREFSDGVLRVEWRWGKKQDEKPNYNGGVYVRTSSDGKIWVQAQVARAEKSPRVGDLFGMASADPAAKRIDVFQKGPSPEAALGDWNVYEITCLGKTVSLRVNGVATATWEDCPIARGHVGLQAEFASYEVRAIKFREIK